jgi:hypothetical protein
VSIHDLPIGILPGSVPDDPVAPVAQPQPPAPAPAMPRTAWGIAEHVLRHLSAISSDLRRMLQLQQSSVRNFIAAGSVSGGGQIGAAPQPIIAANPKRRGLRVQNLAAAGGGTITLGLGQTAPQPGTGIVLQPGGVDASTWDGMVSGAVWTGSVSIVGSTGGISYSFLDVP